MACCWAGVSGWGARAGEAVVVLPQALLGGQRGFPVGLQLAHDQAVLRLGQPIAAPRPVGGERGALQSLLPEPVQLGPLGWTCSAARSETSTAAGASAASTCWVTSASTQAPARAWQRWPAP